MVGCCDMEGFFYNLWKVLNFGYEIVMFGDVVIDFDNWSFLKCVIFNYVGWDLVGDGD